MMIGISDVDRGALPITFDALARGGPAPREDVDDVDDVDDVEPPFEQPTDIAIARPHAAAARRSIIYLWVSLYNVMAARLVCDGSVDRSAVSLVV